MRAFAAMAEESTPAVPDGIDPAAVEAWFEANVEGASPPLAFERISGGRSNLTYGVADSDGRRWALRRPPLGERLASAHDMGREHRIISALQGTPVPVPPVAGLCEDESVNGAPFYVMGFVDGAILRSQREATDAFDEGERAAIGTRVVDTLVAIHDVDPDAVGLGELGRREDYAARQLHRWQRQWEGSKTREVPLVDEVHDRLVARIPEQGPATIVHGDYRLDNMILDTRSGEVAAVVDWELCTLGDPLADVGMLTVYWSEPGDDLIPLIDPPTTAPGFPTRAEIRRSLRRAVGARPRPARLLRGPRLLEARGHPAGGLRALRRRWLRQGRRGLRGVREGRRPPRRGGRRGRAPPRLGGAPPHFSGFTTIALPPPPLPGPASCARIDPVRADFMEPRMNSCHSPQLAAERTLALRVVCAVARGAAIASGRAPPSIRSTRS